MIKHTDEAILAKLKELWTERRRIDDAEAFQIYRPENKDEILLTVTDMYESPGLDFKKLLSLSKFFDTMNIETEEEIYQGGCETCDYRSRYGFVLLVRPGDSFTDLSQE